MNNKIMGLHTKLTNLIFHEIDRLNMNEEPVNNCNLENQHQKAENTRVPNNTGRESTKYNLRHRITSTFLNGTTIDTGKPS